MSPPRLAGLHTRSPSRSLQATLPDLALSTIPPKTVPGYTSPRSRAHRSPSLVCQGLPEHASWGSQHKKCECWRGKPPPTLGAPDRHLQRAPGRRLDRLAVRRVDPTRTPPPTPGVRRRRCAPGAAWISTPNPRRPAYSPPCVRGNCLQPLRLPSSTTLSLLRRNRSAWQHVTHSCELAPSGTPVFLMYSINRFVLSRRLAGTVS